MKKILKRLCAYIGVDIRKARSENVPTLIQGRLYNFFEEAKKSGFYPNVIFDVVANRGLWTETMLRVYPSAKYTLFEPQSHLASSLHKLLEVNPQVEWRQVAVSDSVCRGDFVISSWDVTSRLASIKSESTDTIIQVEVTTVDAEASRIGCPPDILKIDAEGNDLLVLDGAEASLGKTEVILIEAAVCCPSISNTVKAVIDRMQFAGYQLVGIVDLNPFQKANGEQVDGVLWLVDMVFAVEGGRVHRQFSNPAQ